MRIVEDRSEPPTLGAEEPEGGLKPPQSSTLHGIKTQKICSHPIAFERADLVCTPQACVPEDAVPGSAPPCGNADTAPLECFEMGRKRPGNWVWHHTDLRI